MGTGDLDVKKPREAAGRGMGDEGTVNRTGYLYFSSTAA